MKSVKDEWETVAREPVEAFAAIKRDLLQNEGIEAVLRGNKASNTAGAINELNVSWGNPLGGVEVRVHRDDAADAREILQAHETNRRCDDDAFEGESLEEGELMMEKFARWTRATAQMGIAFCLVWVGVWLASLWNIPAPLGGLSGAFAGAALLFWARQPRR